MATNVGNIGQHKISGSTTKNNVDNWKRTVATPVKNKTGWTYKLNSNKKN